MRSDLKRNIRALLDAAGDVVREDPDGLTMPAVAARAGLGASTAWRHFPSLDDLMHAYAKQQADDLAELVGELEGNDPLLFRRTLEGWVHIVLRSGPALVQFRSKRGYLERSRADDDILLIARSAWGPGLRQLLAELGGSDRELETSLFLANALLDPREILDLHAHAEMSATQIVDHLDGALRGALRGWAGAPLTSPSDA
jgi:AcrR family transcriptional regulator